MEPIETVENWLNRREDAEFVAVDDGGLSLVLLDRNGERTGAYYEIGGDPNDEIEDK